jgi:hypothetical protein
VIIYIIFIISVDKTTLWWIWVVFPALISNQRLPGHVSSTDEANNNTSENLQQLSGTDINNMSVVDLHVVIIPKLSF